MEKVEAFNVFEFGNISGTNGFENFVLVYFLVDDEGEVACDGGVLWKRRKLFIFEFDFFGQNYFCCVDGDFDAEFFEEHAVDKAEFFGNLDVWELLAQ